MSKNVSDVSAFLDPLMDEVEKGLISRVAGGALVSGVLWGGLGLAVAVVIGWLTPKIPSHPYTWIASLVTGMCALGPCSVMGWWSGFSGGVARGIGEVAKLLAPPIFEHVFDHVARRFDASAVGSRIEALEDALRSVLGRLRLRAETISLRKGEGVMAQFRAGLFKRIAEAIEEAFAGLEVTEGTASLAALRPRFVQSATDIVVNVFERQRSRLQSIAIGVWITVFLAALIVLSAMN